jgi:hypothetical protein
LLNASTSVLISFSNCATGVLTALFVNRSALRQTYLSSSFDPLFLGALHFG